MISEEIVRLFLLMNLFVLLVELHVLIFREGLYLHILEIFQRNNRLSQSWHLVLNTSLELSLMTITSASLVST